jgi:galactokinase
MISVSDLASGFRQIFGTPAVCYRAPGRVNLIGEHTDYNGGFVLPAAIAYFCWAAASPRDDGKLVVYSANFREIIETPIGRAGLRPSGKWSDYALGVAWALQEAGYELRGNNIYVYGEVPLGAGLSSSAAFEVAVAGALLAGAGYEIDRTKIALIAQQAENDFVGARCGIMDQFVSSHGRAGHAVLLDCRSLEYSLIAVPPDVCLVVCNTMVKHQLGDGQYNTRRLECEEGVKRLSAVLPGIATLRDVSLPQLESNRDLLSDVIYRRCRHVITENGRVPRAAEALERGDKAAFSQLMETSHRSLRDDYQVSCPELDLMVDLAGNQPGVRGSRMTGAGFGGCTVNVVDRDAAAAFKEHIAAEYRHATGRHPDIFICETSDGAARVSLENDLRSTTGSPG